MDNLYNLHKLYYKDYLSPYVKRIDKSDSPLTFLDIVKEEEKNGLSNSDADKRRKQDLQREIEKIQKNNAGKIGDRNQELTKGNYFKDRNKKELKEEFLIKNDISPNDEENRIKLEIAYPGLVTGVGIDHEAKITGEFKLGVHFDWTHGMPVVYGSSVKGVLRSAFKDGYVDEDFVKQANKQVKDNNPIPEWVGNKANRNDIIRCIFEGENTKGENLSIYNRDIFFDAVIIKPDSQGRILCSDSITPHGENPLKNPIPITFLKIAPGCTMEFRFKLTDSDLGEGKILTAAQKKTLFEEILKTVGVGAKTNVGYGQLKSVKVKGLNFRK